MQPPLEAIRVVELAGLAPGPFASLLLADYGASVLRIDRPHPLAYGTTSPPPTADLLTRNKSSIAVNLKTPGGHALLLSILQEADVFLDTFRPGVLESLSLAPEMLLERNPRLVIARLTGFRRDGPYSSMAGHDINYLAVSGVLSQLGRAREAPYAPANILADFAGGGLMCAFGIVLALFERAKSGKGQVIENSMVDGVSYLASMLRFARKTPLWDRPRGENVLDGGCPWYDVYECKDGRFIAVGALEPHFFRHLLNGLDIGLDPEDALKSRNDRTGWPKWRELFRRRFQERTRREWEHVFDGSDACCTPLLDQHELEEASYEQRLPIHLGRSAGIAPNEAQAWASTPLSPGAGGVELLHRWFGWKEGRDFKAAQGGLIKIEAVKI
ncbi:MAG: hypothetical protein Q9207_004231 [Kuettlingeria erythrocarpa]